MAGFECRPRDPQGVYKGVYTMVYTPFLNDRFQQGIGKKEDT